ncbi:hypothetical protein B566_EDAN008966, partial [Ephemera danica]
MKCFVVLILFSALIFIVIDAAAPLPSAAKLTTTKKAIKLATTVKQTPPKFAGKLIPFTTTKPKPALVAIKKQMAEKSKKVEGELLLPENFNYSIDVEKSEQKPQIDSVTSTAKTEVPTDVTGVKYVETATPKVQPDINVPNKNETSPNNNDQTSEILSDQNAQSSLPKIDESSPNKNENPSTNKDDIVETTPSIQLNKNPQAVPSKGCTNCKLETVQPNPKKSVTKPGGFLSNFLSAMKNRNDGPLNTVQKPKNDVVDHVKQNPFLPTFLGGNRNEDQQPNRRPVEEDDEEATTVPAPAVKPRDKNNNALSIVKNVASKIVSPIKQAITGREEEEEDEGEEESPLGHIDDFFSIFDIFGIFGNKRKSPNNNKMAPSVIVVKQQIPVEPNENEELVEENADQRNEETEDFKPIVPQKNQNENKKKG